MKIAFDTETTGLQPGCRPVEIAAVLVGDTGIFEVFETLVNPECPIQQEAIQIHGITQDAVADAPTFGEAFAMFVEWVEATGCTEFLAHNASFDCGLMSWNAARCGVSVPDGWEVTDTLAIAKAIKATKNNKLETLADHYRLERSGRAHSALSDAGLVAQYWNQVKGDVEGLPSPWQDFVKYDYPEALPEGFEDVPDLVERGKSMVFRYRKEDGEESERRFDPWSWVRQWDNVHLHGWCHLKRERRQFRCDRIVERLPAEDLVGESSE